MDSKTSQKILKKVVEDYNNIAESFNKSRKSDWSEFEIFLPYTKDNQTLCDLGCGNGRFFSFLKKHKKVQYTGIDKCEKLLFEAKKEHPDGKFINADILSIPLPENSTDIASAIASIHHIPSKKLREQAIKEIHRIIKKDGIFLITVWNLFQPKYKKYIWRSRIKHLVSFGKYDIRDTFIPWEKSGIKRYYYAFKSSELKKLLSPYFEIVKENLGNNITFICRKK